MLPFPLPLVLPLSPSNSSLPSTTDMLTSPSPTPLGGTGVSSPAPRKKRRPAGTPDPNAEVVALSPRKLLESDRYVCEICNQGFQRDQNLQMHRRRHKVPWKLLKREGGGGGSGAGAMGQRNRVYVCPEPSCLHHEAGHALGDLVGIKKHFRRKHSAHRQWACARCSKAYAVQSDYKAHIKTCGTRGHSCDCGRVFSRVEGFIQHQDACNVSRARAEPPPPPSTPSQSPSADAAVFLFPKPASPLQPERLLLAGSTLELQLLPPSNAHLIPRPSTATLPVSVDEARLTRLQLSVGEPALGPDKLAHVGALGEEQQLRLVMAEKTMAEEARQQARRQMELGEQELADARRIRRQAQAALERAHALRDRAKKQIDSTLLQIMCRACKQRFQAKLLVTSYVSVTAAAACGEAAKEEEEEEGDRRKAASV